MNYPDHRVASDKGGSDSEKYSSALKRISERLSRISSARNLTVTTVAEWWTVDRAGWMSARNNDLTQGIMDQFGISSSRPADFRTTPYNQLNFLVDWVRTSAPRGRPPRDFDDWKMRDEIGYEIAMSMDMLDRIAVRMQWASRPVQEWCAFIPATGRSGPDFFNHICDNTARKRFPNGMPLSSIAEWKTEDPVNFRTAMRRKIVGRIASEFGWTDYDNMAVAPSPQREKINHDFAHRGMREAYPDDDEEFVEEVARRLSEHVESGVITSLTKWEAVYPSSLAVARRRGLHRDVMDRLGITMHRHDSGRKYLEYPKDVDELVEFLTDFVAGFETEQGEKIDSMKAWRAHHQGSYAKAYQNGVLDRIGERLEFGTVSDFSELRPT